MCIEELVKRMPIDFKGVIVKLVNADGIQVLDY